MKAKYSEYAYLLSHAHKNPYIVPPSVEIDLTNVCNQDCTYCNVAEFIQTVKDKTKVHDYHTLIERLSSWGSYRSKSIGNVNTITFVGGGEPTVRKGYEHIVEHALDNDFLVSMVTNGSYLERLLNINVETIRKISWIGVDVDSGDPALYEEIRRSRQSGVYDKVKNNIKDLTSAGVTVDIKSLLFEKTINKDSIVSTLEYCKEVGARMVYFRLALIDKSVIFNLEKDIEASINEIGEKMGVEVKVNTSRMGERTYKKCHALHLIPVFSADGNVYTCCENRGNEFFSLCNWLTGDFRDEWMSKRHGKMYDELDLATCPPCRPHIHNVHIQESIDKGTYVQDLFF